MLSPFICMPTHAPAQAHTQPNFVKTELTNKKYATYLDEFIARILRSFGHFHFSFRFCSRSLRVFGVFLSVNVVGKKV